VPAVVFCARYVLGLLRYTFRRALTVILNDRRSLSQDEKAAKADDVDDRDTE
jgi:hypothetical protein